MADLSGGPEGPDALWGALADGPDGVAVLDLEGVVAHANAAFAAIHGYEDADAVRGTDWTDVYGDPDRSRAALATAAEEGAWQGRLAGDRGRGNDADDADAGADGSSPSGLDADGHAPAGVGGDGDERPRVGADGSFVVAVTLTPTDDGRVVCHARDVTDRARRLDRLEWYGTIIENVSDPVYTLDTEGRITYVNEYVQEKYDVGYTREELIGEYVSVVLDPEDINRSLSVIRELVNDPDRDSGKCEVTINSADGGVIPAELHITLLPDGQGGVAGTVGVIRDLTGRKRREQGLTVLQRVLRHNVRNETSVILGYADLLLEGVPDEMRSELKSIREAALGLERISEKARHVQNALDERGTRAEPIDVASLLAERAGRFERRYSDADLTFELPGSAYVRAGESLDLILDELIENAVEHNEAGTPRVRIAVERDPVPEIDDRNRASDAPPTGADGGDDRVVVRVDDDGPGIPDGELAVLTEGEEDPLYHGSGMGLWLVNWFVETYGGDLSFGESKWGGASVRVALPAATPSDG